MRGHLYVLTNPHMCGLVKIGYTTRSPEERAAELSQATGVPGRFKVERSWLIDDAQGYERKVHAALAAHRAAGEHYRLTTGVALEQINVMLRLAGVIGDDGLTATEREQIAAGQVAEARRQELARQREVKWLADEEAARKQRAEYQRDCQMHKEAYWPRFAVVGVVAAFGLPALADAMVVIPTSFGMAVIGLIGVGIAAVISSGWADSAVTTRKIGEAKKAARAVATRTEKANGLAKGSGNPSLPKSEAILSQQAPATPQTAKRFVVTYGALYGELSHHILYDVLQRQIVFSSDNKREVIAEARKRERQQSIGPANESYRPSGAV